MRTVILDSDVDTEGDESEALQLAVPPGPTKFHVHGPEPEKVH